MRWLICGLLALFIITQIYHPLVAQAPCQLVIAIDQAPLYNAPLPHFSQQIGVLEQGAVYSVLAYTPPYLDSFIHIALEDNTEVWVLRRHGEMTGDCTETPIDETSITDDASVCTFTLTSTEPMSIPAQTAIPYPVIGFEDQRYLLWLDHAMSVWADPSNGTLGGACVSSPTASVGENARLWTTPDVTLGQRVASLPVDTPVTVLAGPVEGFIQFNSSVTGLWYRVSDASGRMGWLWSERLDFSGEAGGGD